jgi:predicted amidohydrolase
MTTPKKLTVAVTQAEPVWLDLDATVEKTCVLIAEAASHGAQLISFPECWIPGYPAWIWYDFSDFIQRTRLDQLLTQQLGTGAVL